LRTDVQVSQTKTASGATRWRSGSRFVEHACPSHYGRGV